MPPHSVIHKIKYIQCFERWKITLQTQYPALKQSNSFLFSMIPLYVVLCVNPSQCEGCLPSLHTGWHLSLKKKKRQEMSYIQGWINLYQDHHHQGQSRTYISTHPLCSHRQCACKDSPSLSKSNGLLREPRWTQLHLQLSLWLKVGYLASLGLSGLTHKNE